MFGYIKPYKPEMKMAEFDTFKAIYCGLCKQLSHSYGTMSSLTLSYDFTFIATVYLGLSPSCGGFKKCSCVANPLKKKTCHNRSDELEFCAATAMLMLYYKAIDNLHDSNLWGKVKTLAVIPFLSFAKHRAKKQYSHIDTIISTAMRSQENLEKGDTASIDRAAHPTANALALLLEELSPNAIQKKVLNRFGYLLGRYVYFADALDDIDDDIKHKSYNPFLRKLDTMEKGTSLEQLKEYAKGVLNITIAEIAPAYELLELKRYKPILDNVVYLGLHDTINTILTKKNQKAVE